MRWLLKNKRSTARCGCMRVVDAVEPNGARLVFTCKLHRAPYTGAH